MTAACFGAGMRVQFTSLCSGTIFHARIVRRLSPEYYLVEDRTGLGPRPVHVKRLTFDCSSAPWPKEAA